MTTVYVHHVRGRLRIQSGVFRKTPQLAQEVLEHLKQQPGVCRIEFRARTGSIVMAYDANLVKASAILSIFEAHGMALSYEYQPGDPEKRAHPASVLLNTTMSIAWSRLVQELVNALLASTILPKTPVKVSKTIRTKPSKSLNVIRKK